MGTLYEVNSETGNMRVGAGTQHASLALQVDSATQCFGPPSLTSLARTSIIDPDERATLYDSDEKLLNFYDGTTWRQVATIGAQESFMAIDYGSNLTPYRVRQLGTNGTFNFTFCFPFDFGTLIEIALRGSVSAGAAGTGKDIDLTSSYSGVGENKDIYTETDVASTFDLGSTDQTIELDLSSVFTGTPSACDSVGITVDHNIIGGNVHYQFLRLRYYPIGYSGP